MTQTYDRRRERFRELLVHYHARSGKACSVAAELAGLSPAYLNDLLAGRRWRIGLHALHNLCECSWQVTVKEGQELLWRRLIADEGFIGRAYLTKELLWRLAAMKDTRAFAQRLNLDYGYVVQIVTGRRRPAVDVAMAIYHKVGLDPLQGARLYVTDLQQHFPEQSRRLPAPESV